MKITDLIPGKYYHIIAHEQDKTYENISLCKDKLKAEYCLSIHNSRFNPKPWINSTWRTDLDWNIRLATPKEIQYLELCVKEGRFVEKPKIEYYELY